MLEAHSSIDRVRERAEGSQDETADHHDTTFAEHEVKGVDQGVDAQATAL